MGTQDPLLVIGQPTAASPDALAAERPLVSRATTAAGLQYLDAADHPVRAVITTHDPPEIDCFRLLDATAIPVIVVTQNGTSQLATDVLREGATSYLDLTAVDDEVAAIADALGRLTTGESDAAEADTSSTPQGGQHAAEFTSIISHELRTPVQKARSGVDLIAADCDSEYIDEVRETLDRMEELLVDLLAIAKYGDSVGETEPVDLDAVVTAAWPDPPGAKLEIDTPLPTVAAEPSRLRQLFENLFRNSVEHGSTGGDTLSAELGDGAAAVTVRVGVIDDSDSRDDDTIGFYVEDDGPGIPPAKRQQVFEYGYTGSDDGTGLGLAICEQIVDAFGWEIAVTESHEGGARFEIRQVRRDS